MSKRKYTPDVLAVGAAAYVISAATQKVLLTPSGSVELTQNIKIPVKGLIPFSQRYIANISRVALNNMLPFFAKSTSSFFSLLKTKDRLREGVLWFIYDFLNRYSLNTLVSKVLSRFSFVEKGAYKDVLRELIQRIITEKTDRDAIIQLITSEIVSLLRLLSEGTLAAMIFNDRFASAASVTIATAVDRFLENDAASKFTDFFFRIVSQLEDITVTTILTSLFKLDRAQLGAMIDSVYDSVIGDKMVDTVRDLKLGDLAYEMISGVDYDALYGYISENMSDSLKRLNITGATAAMYFFSGAKGIVFKAQKRSNKKAEKKSARRAKRELLKNEDA